MNHSCCYVDCDVSARNGGMQLVQGRPCEEQWSERVGTGMSEWNVLGRGGLHVVGGEITHCTYSISIMARITSHSTVYTH